jgi:hypothetical protein
LAKAPKYRLKKRQPLEQLVLAKQYPHQQYWKWISIFYTVQNQFKMDQRSKSKTVNLETVIEKHRKISWIHTNKDHFSEDCNCSGNKRKNGQNCIKLKSFCTLKETITRIKKQSINGRKIIASYSSDKGLISIIYKDLQKINTKRKNNSINKWANEFCRQFSQEVQSITT